MSQLLIALFAAAGLALAVPVAAQMSAPMPTPTPMSKASHTQLQKDADAQFKLDKDACGSLAGNAKDICIAEAKGKHNVAKGDADAVFKNTPKARENARVVRAEAIYSVAAERCDDLSGNPKDVCVKEAKSDLVKGKANAKVDRVTADTSRDAATKQAEVRKDASADKRDADYKVALEKCDALAGAAKDACVGSAKAQFGKT